MPVKDEETIEEEDDEEEEDEKGRIEIGGRKSETESRQIAREI